MQKNKKVTMDENKTEELGLQCCFCGNGIKSSQSDPCSINVIVNYDKPKNRQYDQFFWCHITCFKQAITPDIPLYIEDLGHHD